jgi:hypothetical protein
MHTSSASNNGASALPKPGANPALDRRTSIIARLEEQKQLLSDANFMRTVQARIEKDGVKTAVQK